MSPAKAKWSLSALSQGELAFAVTIPLYIRRYSYVQFKALYRAISPIRRYIKLLCSNFVIAIKNTIGGKLGHAHKLTRASYK